MGGGYLNNNKLTYNKKYVVLLLIFLVGFLTIYINTSYGFFKKKDYLTSIDFVAGTLDYKIESSSLENNSLTVNSKEERKIELTLTSLNSIDSKYELYYLIDGEKVTDNNIEIGYTSDSVDSVKGIISSNSKKNITVRIKNNSSNQVNIYIGCEGGLINNELVMSLGNSLDRLILDGDVMLAYTYIGENTGPPKFPSSTDEYYISELTCTGGTAVWDNDTWSMKVTSTTAQSISCNATVIDKPESSFIVNEPVISTGMIPVIYDGSDWIKANVNSKWYDYENKKWANAVTVSEENRTSYVNASAGTIINMDDINTMWVWIPRYEYETITSTSATEIKVNFLNGIQSNITNNYITHPAFTFGDKELTGIWVAKFEASSNEECSAAAHVVDTRCDITTLKVNIKPGITSWRGIRISTADLNTRSMNDSGNIYGFVESEIDTHVMKNIEWGAVAYLTQSEYGRCVDGKCTEVTINSGNITGDSKYSTEKGQLQSTTGNIYGIYDMAGGSEEFVMAVMTDDTGENIISGTSSTINSGFTGKVYTASGICCEDYLGRSLSDKKYFDFYEFGTSSGDRNRYKFGDATTETKSWYSDSGKIVAGSNSWFERGNSGANGTSAGIFSSYPLYGAARSGGAFRPVLVEQ